MFIVLMYYNRIASSWQCHISSWLWKEKEDTVSQQ